MLFSCVVDNKAIFQGQCFFWVNSLLYFSGIAPENIYLHVIGDVDKRFKKWANKIGVQLIPSQRFDSNQPYCNKLVQLKTFSDKDFDYLFLMDCDTLFLERVTANFDELVYAKPVDFATPSLEIIDSIFKKIMALPARPSAASFKKNDGTYLTDRNNCNGGVYILSKKIISTLNEKWIYWAKACIKQKELFGSLHIHIDQVSFAMAMLDIKQDASLLDLSWNYPVHVDHTLLPNISPKIIHYHRQISPEKTIQTIGVPLVDKKIEEFNDFIQKKILKDYFGEYFVTAMVKEMHGPMLSPIKGLIKNIKQFIYTKTLSHHLRPDMEINCSIDDYREEKHFIYIRGWAFIAGQDAVDNEIFIILRSKEGAMLDLVLRTWPKKRPDVSECFKGLALDNSGFEIRIDKRKLLVKNSEVKELEIGLLIRSKKGSALKFISKLVRFEN